MKNSTTHTTHPQYLHPPPQPPLEVHELDMPHEFPTETEQSALQASHFPAFPQLNRSNILLPRPQMQAFPERDTPESYPSAPGIPGTMVTIPLSSPRATSHYSRSESSDSRPMHFSLSAYRDIRRAVLAISRGASEMCPCLSCIRVQVMGAIQFFISGLEFVADGLTMYDEMCNEGFEYLTLLRRHIEDTVRYIEGNEDRNV